MKNRKLISFLSLFSLVLILGVYYVLLPPTNFPIDNNTDITDVTVNQGEDAYFINLQLDKEEERLKEIEVQSLIVSSAITTEEKVVALENIASIQKILIKEKEITRILKEAGYQNVYTEYENKTINLLVSKKDPGVVDAAKIIGLVYRKVGTEFTPKITFRV